MTNTPNDASWIATRLRRLTGLNQTQIDALSLTLDPIQVDQINDADLASLVNGTLPGLPLNASGGLPLGLPGATAPARFVGGTASGAPTSGTFAVRDWVVTGTGAFYVCTVAGTPGTWVQVSGGGGTSDASTSAKGIVQLAGDLGGTAASPTVPGLAAKAPLASPALTGTPTAPTAAAGTNTTQVATTAFVAAQSSARSTIVNAVEIAAANAITVDPTGVADQTALMDACYVAAKAALGAGGKAAVIRWPAGTFLFSPGSSRYALPFDPNLTGEIVLEGAGTKSTTFKGSANCTTLVGPGTYTSYDTFRYLRLRNFTWDAASLTPTTRGVITHFDHTLPFNIDSFEIAWVDVINAPATWTGTTRRCVNLVSTHSTYGLADPQTTIKNVYIHDCTFGRSGGGANTGVLVSGYYSGSGSTPFPPGSFASGDVSTNVYADNIIVERVTWRSGLTTFAGKSTSVEGVGVMISANGGMARIRDCVLVGSTDDLIEINSMTDVVVEGCYTEDSMSEAVYIRPGAKGIPNPSQQRIVVRDHTHRNNLILGSSLSVVPNSLYCHSKDGGRVAGAVVAENINVITDGAPSSTMTGGGAMLRVIGGFRSVVLRNIRTDWTNWTSTFSIGVQVRGMEVLLPTGRGTVDISNVSCHFSGVHNGSGNLTLAGLYLGYLGDHRLKVDGLHPSWEVSNAGAGTVSTREVEIMATGGQSTADGFGATSSLANSYRADTGALADLAIAGGVLTSVANHTTEKRLTWVRNEGPDYAYGNVGPFTDGLASAKFTVPTSPATGYKAGVRLKADLTGTNSVHCYVGYDGTNYSINVDTELAGVVTNQSTTVIGTTIASPFWVRGSVIASAVVADYCTSAVGGRGITPTATTTASYTLSGTPLATFGSNAAQGFPGLVWVPQDTGSTVDDLTKWHRHYGSMSFFRCSAREITGAGIGSTGFVLASKFSESGRSPKPVIIEDCDYTSYAAVTEFSTLSNSQYFDRRNIGWVTVPAAAAITVSASPFTYVNQDGYAEDVSMYGGTVSSVTLARAGGTAAQVASATGMTLRLQSGDTIIVTYSSAPTLRKTPVL